MEIDHQVQLSILRQLLFNPKSRFSELNKTQLDNDHFVFHLKRLVGLGLVAKDENLYYLTPQGLETAGRLDLKSLQIVRQPKVGVLICVARKVKGKNEVLLGQRRRDPGKGKIGFYATKVKFGESLLETTKRCLQKETGLMANFAYVGTVHILDKNLKDQQNDRLMIYFRATGVSGSLKKTTVESINIWVPWKEAYKLRNIFIDFKQDLLLFEKGKLFFEERYI